MGIDVSGVLQGREDGGWKSIRTYYQGRRGLLRYWLGWGSGGWYSADLGIRPLFEQVRGLPPDFAESADTDVIPGRLKTADAVGTQTPSWVSAAEVLGALPVHGRRTVFVPASLAQDLLARPVDLQAWAKRASLPHGAEHIGGLCPRLIEATPMVSKLPTHNDVAVACVFEIGDSDIDEFADELRALLTSYREVRLVYGFE